MKQQDFIIRVLRPEETGILEELLYQAVFVPAGREPYPRSVIRIPRVYAYIEGFGRNGDVCFVAESGGRIVGGIWARVLDGVCNSQKAYGNIGQGVPELAISLLPECRKQGIGTALMEHMIAHLRQSGTARVSLSVDKTNYAVRLYKKFGFEIILENDEDYIMVRAL